MIKSNYLDHFSWSHGLDIIWLDHDLTIGKHPQLGGVHHQHLVPWTWKVRLACWVS